MSIRFTKMHGLGNDFMIIDAVNQSINLLPEQICDWARRDTGVGFDQCLLVEPSSVAGVDFFYRIFNANGQEVGQCGNGARCLARFVHHYGLTSKKTVTVATLTTQMQLQLNEDTTVTVNLGKPKFKPEEIPLLAQDTAVSYLLPLAEGGCSVHTVNVGNPHAVTVVDNLEETPIATLGKAISEHPMFPEQTNAGFMKLLNKNQLALRVYERGCGETKACGSAAVAAAAVGRLYYDLDEQIEVKLPGGELVIEWPSITGPIFLRGPAVFVYEGNLL